MCIIDLIGISFCGFKSSISSNELIGDLYNLTGNLISSSLIGGFISINLIGNVFRFCLKIGGGNLDFFFFLFIFVVFFKMV